VETYECNRRRVYHRRRVAVAPTNMNLQYCKLFVILPYARQKSKLLRRVLVNYYTSTWKHHDNHKTWVLLIILLLLFLNWISASNCTLLSKASNTDDDDNNIPRSDTVALKYYIRDGRMTITWMPIHHSASSSGNNPLIFTDTRKLTEARCEFY